MENDLPSGRPVRFKNFKLDLRTRELYKKDFKVKLRGQPIEVLAILIESPGELVTREALRQALWPQDTFVDFEHSLNSTINKLREALGDSPEAPQFIETIPRLGYRFIAPIVSAAPAVEAGAPAKLLLKPIAKPLESGIRLAVLPFTNAFGDPQDRLAEGLSTQMIVQLGRTYKHVSIIGPVSSVYFTAETHSLPVIAEVLRADYLLAGSIWRVNAHVRLFAQLIRTADQCTVWSESYTREDSDLLSVLNLITRDISHGLRQALPITSQPDHSPATTPENYEKYLRARFFSYRFDQASFTKATGLFEEVIEADPEFAPAHAGLAHMLTALAVYGGGPAHVDIYERIAKESGEALRLTDTIAEAHSARGWLGLWQADWEAAENEFLRGIEVDPSFGLGYCGYSHLLTALGRHEEAIATASRATDLDPLSPNVHVILGLALYTTGKFAEAIESELRALELEPGYGPALASLSMIYETMGDLEKSLDYSRKAVEHNPETHMMMIHLGRSLAIAGHVESARAVLGRLLEMKTRIGLSSCLIALIYTALDQPADAWAWLERAFAEQDPWRVFLNADPRFRYFAGDPRFAELLAQLHLPQ